MLPSPDQTNKKLKREPQSLGCCRAGPMLLGWGNEKVQNHGEPMPNFFSDVDLIVFPAFFFFKF